MNQKHANQYEHSYAVIMAGGSGTRLWPMSRKQMPKQFQALYDSQTMLQMMYQLIREVLPPSQICVQVDKRFQDMVKTQLPELPEQNVLIEPEARDTGPAFSFATAALLQRDSDAQIAIFWSDHIIKNRAEFVKSLTMAFKAVTDFPEYIVSIGVKPTHAHTGLGYIQMKSEAKAYPEGEVFYVERFIEKPDQVTADRFVKSWEYLWNTGYSIFNAQQFLTLVEQSDPAVGKVFRQVAKLMSQPQSEERDKQIAETYGTFPKISIDYLVMEKVKKLMVIPADLDWSDIGNWSTLHGMLQEVTGHHMITRGNHIGVDCEGCLVYSQDRLVATFGLKDIVVVDTGDAILVADKNSATDMKKLVKALEEHDKHMYL